MKLENIVQLWLIYYICASFSWLVFISPKFVRILKNFDQSCDCMNADFRNSAATIALLYCNHCITLLTHCTTILQSLLYFTANFPLLYCNHCTTFLQPLHYYPKTIVPLYCNHCSTLLSPLHYFTETIATHNCF